MRDISKLVIDLDRCSAKKLNFAKGKLANALGFAMILKELKTWDVQMTDFIRPFVKQKTVVKEAAAKAINAGVLAGHNVTTIRESF